MQLDANPATPAFTLTDVVDDCENRSDTGDVKEVDVQMLLDKLKEDVYKVPLDKLEPDYYYNPLTDCGCLIGQIALLNGFATSRLHITDLNDLSKLHDIRGAVADIYETTRDVIRSIEMNFDERFRENGPPKTHDELWEIVVEAVSE